mmetsp:Transcript_2072/g.5125  ORF Transcript_2072/g.5125 Transcript_2072/m.5125 type:complete len:268 (+) Transcript_2072:2-805(+)
MTTARTPHREDTRIHACIYMLSPTGRGVKASDLHVMKAIHSKVNLIPVVARADGLTSLELASFKKILQAALKDHGVTTYTPADPDVQSAYKVVWPLATVASRDFIAIAGRSVRVRRYPWGLVEVENPQYSQVSLLRDMIFRDCTLELISSTQDRMYESYRKAKLEQIGFRDIDPEGKPIPLVDRNEVRRREIDGGHDNAISELHQKYVKLANEKEIQFVAARQALSEKYNRLMEIHRKEQEIHCSKLEELKSSRDEWTRAQQRGKKK